MNWILDHLQLLFVIAGAFAWWLNQRKQVRSGDEASSNEGRSFEDPDLAERTRRIREEIQRKIEQRARGHVPDEQPPVLTETPQPPVVREVVITRQPEPLRHTMTRLEAQRQAEILEQQAALAERLRQADEMKAAALRRIQFESQLSGQIGSAQEKTSNPLGDDLRDARALRRAFVLREILGPPVALRQ
jgi:hypothetical protein